MRTGRLAPAVAEPGVSALYALGPQALLPAATALLGAVQWEAPPGASDWEALAVEGLTLVRRGGAMVSLQRDASGRAVSLTVTDPSGEGLTCSWSPDGACVVSRPGEEAEIVTASGDVVAESAVLDRLLEGVDALSARADSLAESPLPPGVPTDPTAVAPRLWGSTDEEEAAWSGDMLLPGVSLASLGGLVAAWRALPVGRTGPPEGVAPERPAEAVAPEGLGAGPAGAELGAERPGAGRAAALPAAERAAPDVTPERPAAPGRTCAACGRKLAADARFCSGCGRPQAPACAACGVELREVASFCHRCGARVGA